MRKMILVALGAILVLGVGAVAALGHSATGDGVCYVNDRGQDVIGARMFFHGFTSENKPVTSIDVKVDGIPRVHETDFTFPRSDGQWPGTGLRRWVGTTPGTHSLYGTAGWPKQGDEPHSFYAKVDCPKPTPTPTPTPTPMPTPTPTPTATPPRFPPPPHLPSPPPPKHKPKAHRFVSTMLFSNHDPAPVGEISRARRCSMSTWPRGITHGLVHFRPRCPGHRIINGSVRWSVRPVHASHQRRIPNQRIGWHNGRPHFTGLSHHTKQLNSYLFDGGTVYPTGPWSLSNIFGTYQVRATGRER